MISATRPGTRIGGLILVNGTASGGSGSRLLVTTVGRSDVRPGSVAGGWKTCHVPRRTWLDGKIDVFLEELAASGMHLDRQRAGELITGQVRAVATLMRVTGATARSYLGDEIIKDMARRVLFEVAGERPGADLMEAARTVPLPLALVGITVAALAEAMQVRAANEPPVPRGRHHHLRADAVRARADHRRHHGKAGRQPG